ncbi:MAG: aminotransferase class V-fold PLP-dependent enzyme [Bryobacterales bacterium]|nr:aminotransferase class V-fold PLP-dependent enzyme [Bryobacterales bacterium]
MIYLDYNATTPVLPVVWSAMADYFDKQWGNPSSAHSFGLNSHRAIDIARAIAG